MLKLIARAVLPFLAAVSVAQAETTAGRITYINPASHEVLVDNVPVRLAAAASLSGLEVGDHVNVAYPMNAKTGARIAAYAPIVEQSDTGRVTFISADRVVINNASMQIPAGMDLSTLRIGNRAEVTFISVAGLNTAVAISSPSVQLASAEGRITYVNPTNRLILVDSSTWIKIPVGSKIDQYQVGGYLAASYASTNGINVAMTLASL
jgi:hypothetical protein